MNDIESEFSEGKSAFERKDHENAFKMLLPCAEQGHAEAQAIVGYQYYMGLGVDQDYPDAIKWLEAAASQGRGEAAHNLGTLYLTCDPVLPVDKSQSKKWYLKAKELGFVVAPEEWYNSL